MRHLALCLLVSTLAGCASEAPVDGPTSTARLTFDLEADSLFVDGPAGARTVVVPGDLTSSLAGLRSLLAAGADDADLRRALGRSVLGSVEDLVRDADTWVVRTRGTDPVPGLLASLPAWIAPWDGTAIGGRHALRFDWPLGLTEQRARPRDGGDGSMLLFAPFHTDEPAADDPDTLRLALRAAVARVDLVPRNDGDASDLRRALENSAPGWLWMRVAPGGLPALRPAFGALPPSLVWSRPGPGSLDLLPNTFASGGEGPARLAVVAWFVSERTISPVVTAWMDAVARGNDLASGLREARRRAIEAGRPPHVWASIAVVDVVAAQAPLDRAPWLRRTFAVD